MKLSEAEWKVMKAVWNHHPASVREVLEAAESAGWAYSTVKTMLARLAGKGALKVIKRGSVRLHEPLVSRDQARETALRSLLELAFDGTFGSLVHHALRSGRLSARDREELRASLEAEKEADVESS